MSTTTVPQTVPEGHPFSRTPLFFASYQGLLEGVMFHLGDSVVFAPDGDDALYLVEPACLLKKGRVAEDAARHLEATVLTPRLARLGLRT